MSSMLPQSPDMLRFVGEDIACNSLTILQSAGSVGLRFVNGAVNAGSGARNIVTGATTLTAAQSGSLCLFNNATGYTFTLPVPVVGLWFEFLVTVTNTATADKIITNAGTVFLVGEVLTFVDNTTPGANPGPKGFSFNGTTHVACTMGGADTTTGGVAGTRVRVECISATQWAITGHVVAAGTIATPAATS